jgi:hypothetical protein
VNLRDIGEVDPRLRKGVLFRCSQIYTPDVLKELKIRTVVDLRGRAEKKNAKASKSGKDGKAAAAAPAGPPQLLPYDQVESLTSSGPAGSPSAAAAGANLNRGQQGGGPGPAGASSAAPSTASPADDIAVTRLRHNASSASISSVDSEEESGNGNGNVRRASGAEEMAVGLTEGVEDAMGFGTPDRETFNVIPTKEFGLAMLRMPW